MTLPEIMSAILLILLILFWPASWIVRSYVEKESFNRLTGSRATLVDAMFTELRVIATPKE